MDPCHRKYSAGAPVRYKLVPMSRDNVGQIADIEQECFSHPWSRRMLEEELDNLSASFIAAQAEDGTILGVCRAYCGVG